MVEFDGPSFRRSHIENPTRQSRKLQVKVTDPLPRTVRMPPRFYYLYRIVEAGLVSPLGKRYAEFHLPCRRSPVD